MRRSVLASAVSALVLLAAAPAVAAAGPPDPRAGAVGVPGATSVQGPAWASCTDTALLATFPTPPTVTSSGTIPVTDLATGAVADRIDLADPASSLRDVGGAVNADGTLHAFHYFPITVDGDTAQIHLHKALDAGHRYQATATSGVFAGQTGTLSWNFRTKPAHPAGRVITVSADGHADYCTVQGAVDAVPATSTKFAQRTVCLLLRLLQRQQRRRWGSAAVS